MKVLKKKQLRKMKFLKDVQKMKFLKDDLIKKLKYGLYKF